MRCENAVGAIARRGDSLPPGGNVDIAVTLALEIVDANALFATPPMQRPQAEGPGARGRDAAAMEGVTVKCCVWPS